MLFADEMSMRVDHRSGTAWGVVGQSPVAHAGAGHRPVKMFSALASDGTLRYRLGHGVMDRWAFLGFCAQLLRTITRPIVLIVDGSSIHTARAVRDFTAPSGGRLRLFFLLACAPELNPDEWVNQNIKARAARKGVADEHELAAAMHRGMRRLQKRSDIVRGFFADLRLAYISPSVGGPRTYDQLSISYGIFSTSSPRDRYSSGSAVTTGQPVCTATRQQCAAHTSRCSSG
ncbi:transposase [Planomonospora sphaerica]|uniref:Transposase n=1 Tax=Planomonospora sphaerica TaxID=161355 RepID=A0A171DIK8_9ACTN|nr:transposase [Planomonospora sphaerica]GAT68732.1 transposase [Planomonospora sphaerica]